VNYIILGGDNQTAICYDTSLLSFLIGNMDKCCAILTILYNCGNPWIAAKPCCSILEPRMDGLKEKEIKYRLLSGCIWGKHLACWPLSVLHALSMGDK
jgi:hypothetical protein